MDEVAMVLWKLLHNGKEFNGDNEELAYYVIVTEKFLSDPYVLKTVKELT